MILQQLYVTKCYFTAGKTRKVKNYLAQSHTIKKLKIQVSNTSIWTPMTIFLSNETCHLHSTKLILKYRPQNLW